MALKITYSDHVFLIRGNHEDAQVNRYMGFGQECRERLNEDIDAPDSVFNTINTFFENLPLAAVVGDSKGPNKIFCCHGGIGTNSMKLEDIKSLNRTLRVSFEQQTAEQQRVVDLLWSDPCDDEETRGLVPNTTRDPTGQVGALKKFGADMVEKFLKTNGFSMIIRSHQHLMRGEDRFAQGQLMTVSSCTDYCGVTGNSAGFLTVQKRLVISPKIIQPSPASKAVWRDLPDDPATPAILKRAPTPPRHSS
jgi:diadenosine tetraphosphatase ApaH/serine/threonine PP2A family protein phosphatase